MSKLQLDDGWYKVPGDGATDGPHLRIVGIGSGRRAHFVYVKDGIPASTLTDGVKDQTTEEFRALHPDIVNTYDMLSCTSYLLACEKAWGLKLADLLAPPKQGFGEVLPPLAFAGGAALFVGIVKAATAASKAKKKAAEAKKEQLANEPAKS